MLPSGISHCWVPKKPKGNAVYYIKPTGAAFINGVCSKYSKEFPPELVGVIDQEEFIRMMERINGITRTYWPCGPALAIGFGLCPFTCGLSMFVPW